jgi:hypothetical protein
MYGNAVIEIRQVSRTEEFPEDVSRCRRRHAGAAQGSAATASIDEAQIIGIASVATPVDPALRNSNRRSQ